MARKKAPGNGTKVTRYTYEDVKEPRTPETGHTALLFTDEQLVTLPIDNGWSKAIEVGKLRSNSATLLSVATGKHRRTEYKHADSGNVSARYLDDDCFVDCQMFFDFTKALNLKAALKAEIDREEYKLQLTSQPLPVRGYKRIAVKVVDVYGNESTVVRDLNGR